MIIRCDPDKLGIPISGLFEKMIPPGGKDGVVVARSFKQIETIIGLGRVGDKCFLSSARGFESIGMRTREITRQEYARCLNRLDREEYKQIGAVFDNQCLGGKTYLIKWVEPNRVAKAYFGTADQILDDFSKVLDSILVAA